MLFIPQLSTPPTICKVIIRVFTDACIATGVIERPPFHAYTVGRCYREIGGNWSRSRLHYHICYRPIDGLHLIDDDLTPLVAMTASGGTLGTHSFDC